MKAQMKHLLLFTLTSLALTGCTSPKDELRQPHESAREWNVPASPVKDEVTAQSFTDFDLNTAYKILENPKSNLVTELLLPLSDFVLNAKFVESTRYQGVRLDQMINIFNRAFLKRLDAKDSTADFLNVKAAHYRTVFSGCSVDLSRDCINAELFSNDGFHTRVFTRLAQELDGKIDSEITAAGTPALCVEKTVECRAGIEERYRLLAMAARKRNRNDDPEFSFAYLKHARAFAELVEYDREHTAPVAGADNVTTGYLAEVHSKIFETLISHYKPEDVNSPEFKTFVENFNPWVYSKKHPDIFRYGTRIMFEFGTQCCLYKNNEKTALSDAVQKAIDESQTESDAYGLTFRQMISEIKAKFGYDLFNNLGMSGDIAKLENPKSDFYNEYFLVVDRLFRGHLDTNEVQMILNNAPEARTKVQLPKVITTYMKVYLIYMVVETNTFMANIFTSDIASDKIFEQATQRSRDLTSRWHSIQGQIELLNTLMGSFFKGRNMKSAEYDEASRQVKAVNRTIHYISVNTTEILMTYFLSKLNGTIEVRVWWGLIKIEADTILDAFFDGGIAAPWFRFGKDPEPLDRHMLLFSWEYLLSTKTLNSFTTNEGATPEEERGKFFDLIFSNYIGDNLFDIRKQLNDFERTSFGSKYSGTAQALCDYEMGRTSHAPRIEIGFLDLGKFTYSGLGGNGANIFLNKVLTEPGQIFTALRGIIDSRATYIRAMVDIIEFDLLRSKQIQARGEPHRNTLMAYARLAELEELKQRIARTYGQNQKAYRDCSLRLQEIERRRINRLYLEEREHLGKIFDLIRPLVKLTEEEREAKVAEINATYFRAPGSGYRFDKLNGLSYSMSKYDLFKRIQANLEKDVFRTPHELEKSQYGGSDADYYRPRNVSVLEANDVERDPMVGRQLSNPVFVEGDTDMNREDFIAKGMATFNGLTDSFVVWQGQRSSDAGLFNSIDTLVNFYLLGPITDRDGKVYQTSPKEIVEAYVSVLASYTLDPIDVKIAKELMNDGRFERKYYTEKLFEANGTRLPLFYSLMNTVRGRAGLLLENSGGPAQQALEFARALINLRTFVFPPSTQVGESVKRLYGERVHLAFQRTADVFDEMSRVQDLYKDPQDLDPRLVRTTLLQEGREIKWYTGSSLLVDSQKRSDLRILIDDFRRRTNNFYETLDKVKFQ